MAVRVKILVKSNEKEVVTSALLNSGFESLEPDIAIPIRLAEVLRLWPPKEFEVEDVETAGGQVTSYLMRNVVKIKLITQEHELPEIACNILINPHIDEVLISDYVIDLLEVEVVSFSKGLWKLKNDPPNKIRKSEQRQVWR